MKNISTNSTVSCLNCSLESFCLPHILNDEELKTWEEALEKAVKLEKKSFVFKKGDRLRALYAIKSGSIKTFITSSEGEEQILGFHLPGDLVGFDAFGDHKHICHAQTLDDALVCLLPIHKFESLCDNLPGIRRSMMTQIGKEISREHEQLLTLGKLQSKEKLAAFLLKLSERNKIRGFSNSKFYLPMSRSELANYLGMAVETLSRMIALLRKEDVITIKHRLVCLKDIKRLKQLAQR